MLALGCSPAAGNSSNIPEASVVLTNQFVGRNVQRNENSSFAEAINSINISVPPQARQTMPSDFPPWTLSPLCINISIPGLNSKKTLPQFCLLQLALAHINARYSHMAHIFTDGSTTPHGSSSGVFISSTGKALSYRLERTTSSTSAELHALKQALRYILRQPPAEWAIFTDSKAALQTLRRASCFSLHEHVSRDVTYLHHLAYVAGHRVTLQWIPAHCGILGNEKADEAARRGLQLRNVRKIFFTKHEAAALAKELALAERNRLWSCPETRHPFLHHIDPGLRMRLPERIPRKLETLYHRLRLNAALTNSYRHRLGLTANPYCDNCGLPETVEHVLLECPAYIQERTHLAEKIECLNNASISLKGLLGPWPSPSSQRKVLVALFDYLHGIGLAETI